MKAMTAKLIVSLWGTCEWEWALVPWGTSCLICSDIGKHYKYAGTARRAGLCMAARLNLTVTKEETHK